MRRFPAEWEPHAGTIFTWPWDEGIWGDAHEAAQEAIAAAARFVATAETVWLCVPDASWEERVAARLGLDATETADVRFVHLPADDVWVRDHGPTVVVDAERLVAVDWNFNAWGGKFPHDRDDKVAARIAPHLSAAHERAEIVLEGGAIETDGRGTVLCTRSVAFTTTRNPGMTEAAAEAELRRRLGVQRVVWLDGGMACDDTDGHIDTLARFCPDGRVLAHVCVDPSHPDAERLEANVSALEAALGLEVVRVPAPTFRDEEGALLPASHVNFYVCNAGVLVPVYGEETDDDALAAVRATHPGLPVVALDCVALVGQGGAIHCASQQVPRT